MTTEKMFKANEIDNDISEVRNYIHKLETEKGVSKPSACRPCSKETSDFLLKTDTDAIALKIKKAKLKLVVLEKEFAKL